jgi:1,4-alpha-glucan branching enzyme
VYSWRRHAKDERETLIVVMNMTPVPRPDYRVGAPQAGFYWEILNSDAKIYGGSDLGNGGGVQSEPTEMHGQKQSLTLTLPPLAIVVMKLAPDENVERLPVGLS